MFVSLKVFENTTPNTFWGHSIFKLKKKSSKKNISQNFEVTPFLS